MLVKELFITIIVRYFNYDLHVFQFEQTFRHFRAPTRAPAMQKTGPGQHTSDPPLIGPVTQHF